MTKQMHTPGPWRVGGRDRNIVYAGDGNSVASCAVYHWRFKNGEVEANARLIAAAPENYACNIELAKIVRELCGVYGHPLPEASLARSDAAIAKATRSNE